MERILQRFLDRAMLPIGEDDQKFEYLVKAAEELAQELLEDKQKLITYTAVALDPDVPVDEPVLEEAEVAIKAQWKAYRNKFPETPRQLVRAVILEALSLAVRPPNYAAAAIVWLTGANLVAWAPLGSEKDIFVDFLFPLGEMVEKQAAVSWSSQLPRVQPVWPSFDQSLELSKKYKTNLDLDALTQHLLAAAGSTNAQGATNGPEANPYYPSNAPQQWVGAFGPRAAKGIKEIVDAANNGILANVEESLKGITPLLEAFMSAAASATAQAVEQAASQEAYSQRKINLLWWKETLYSTTLKSSYRRLKPATASLFLAYDLHQQVPDPVPQSFEFLLQETANEAIEEAAIMPLTLKAFCEQIVQDKAQIEAIRLIGQEKEITGRCSLLYFVDGCLHKNFMPKDLKSKVGVAPDVEMPFAEIAVWLFRDVQAWRLAQNGEV